MQLAGKRDRKRDKKKEVRGEGAVAKEYKHPQDNDMPVANCDFCMTSQTEQGAAQEVSFALPNERVHTGVKSSNGKESY